eukprot:2490702-Amphidinium_carterae.1
MAGLSMLCECFFTWHFRQARSSLKSCLGSLQWTGPQHCNLETNQGTETYTAGLAFPTAQKLPFLAVLGGDRGVSFYSCMPFVLHCTSVRHAPIPSVLK